MIELRRQLIGEQHPGSKLLNPQAETIRLRHQQGESLRCLAREYGVSHVTVFKIVWGIRYIPRSH